MKERGGDPRSASASSPTSPPLALVRFGMEAVLRTSIERYYATGGDTLAKWYFGKRIPDFLGHGWRPPRDGEATSPATDGPVQPTDDVDDEVDEIYNQEAV